MQLEQTIQLITLAAIPVLFAITFHEAAHAYAARYFGDMTAYQQGRTSLNPICHIDPIGTIALPLVTLLIGGFLFGWAKPVPVNFAALRRPKQDMLWVSLAGPLSNLVMAIGWALLYKLAFMMPGSYFAEPLVGMAYIGISINVLLCVLNMIPLPPLDGGRILISLLPHRQAYMLSKVEPYGMFILIALALTGILFSMLAPFTDALKALVSAIVGI